MYHILLIVILYSIGSPQRTITMQLLPTMTSCEKIRQEIKDNIHFPVQVVYSNCEEV